MYLEWFDYLPERRETMTVKNIWIDADLHHIIKVQAAQQGITIRAWLEQAARDKLEKKQ